MHMELRFYQTYDKNGVDSENTLQFRLVDDDGDVVDGWQDVNCVRERFPEEGLTAQYDEEDEEIYIDPGAHFGKMV